MGASQFKGRWRWERRWQSDGLYPSMMEVFTLRIHDDLDVLQVIFTIPDLTVFCRLEESCLETVCQSLYLDQAVIRCRCTTLDPR